MNEESILFFTVATNEYKVFIPMYVYLRVIWNDRTVGLRFKAPYVPYNPIL